MDSVTSFGTVRVIKRHKDTGLVLFDETFKNQITNYARGQAAALWAGIPVPIPSKISIGNGTPTPPVTGTTPNDNGLWAEILNSKKVVDYTVVWLQYYTQYAVTYDQTQALGVYDATTNPYSSIPVNEAGLWDSNGNLWSHVVLKNVAHDSQSTLTIQWNIQQIGN